MTQADLVMTTEPELRRILDSWFAPHAEKLKTELKQGLKKELKHELVAELKQEFSQMLEKEINGVLEAIRDLAEHMDRRFNALERDVAQLKADVAKHDERLTNVEEKVTRMELKLDAVVLHNEAQDGHLARHERWYYQAAKKMQIKLT